MARQTRLTVVACRAHCRRRWHRKESVAARCWVAAAVAAVAARCWVAAAVAAVAARCGVAPVTLAVAASEVTSSQRTSSSAVPVG